MEVMEVIKSERANMTTSEQLSLLTPNQYLPNGMLTPPLSDEAAAPLLTRFSETPRTHLSNFDYSLPSNFNQKCSFYVEDCGAISQEEPDPKECTRRLRDNRNYTPKKRVKASMKISIETDESLQEHKENSPIKIEMMAGEFANKTSSNFLILKRPPYKISPHIFVKHTDPFDLLSKLAGINAFHIIQKVCNYLEPIDLINLENVSLNYKEILSKVFSKETLGAARKIALRSKENVGARPVLVARSRNETTPKKLVRINKELPSPKRRIPMSPQLSPSSKRFHYYVQAAKSLGKSERLEKCPRCCFPATRNQTEATCSSCLYLFCVQCRSNSHPNLVCDFFIPSPESPDSRKRHYGIGTKASKKSLRRLL